MINTMTKQQALTVIRQVLDAAIKSGVLISMDQAATLSQAFQLIFQSITANNDSTGDRSTDL
jgi:hypothetical protein